MPSFQHNAYYIPSLLFLLSAFQSFKIQSKKKNTVCLIHVELYLILRHWLMGTVPALECMSSDVSDLFLPAPQLFFFFQWGFDTFCVTNIDAVVQLVAKTTEIIQGFYLLEILKYLKNQYNLEEYLEHTLFWPEHQKKAKG